MLRHTSPRWAKVSPCSGEHDGVQSGDGGTMRADGEVTHRALAASDRRHGVPTGVRWSLPRRSRRPQPQPASNASSTSGALLRWVRHVAPLTSLDRSRSRQGDPGADREGHWFSAPTHARSACSVSTAVIAVGALRDSREVVGGSRDRGGPDGGSAGTRRSVVAANWPSSPSVVQRSGKTGH